MTMLAVDAPVIRRVSWICIQNYSVLFVRKRGTPLYFDPGCRCSSPKNDIQVLIERMRCDLGVPIDPESLERMTSFRAQAYGKPDDTPVENHCYQSVYDYGGQIRPAAGLETAWLTLRNKDATSEAGCLVLQMLDAQGFF